MGLNFFGIVTGIGLCFFLLYTRKKKWAKPKIRWIFCSLLFITGITGLLTNPFSQNNYFLLYWGLIIPLAYYAIDRFFRHLSFKVYNRDFILWLRYSDEIDYRIFGSNPHVKALDRLFSILLLIIIIVLVMMGAVLAHKYGNM